VAVAVVTFTAGLSDPWPAGKPARVEHLPDGSRRCHMEDGDVLTLKEPTYLLEYISAWSAPDDIKTYSVNIGLTGRLLHNRRFFEAWNFDIDERRHYRFDKTHRLVGLKTGQILTGEELCKDLEGAME
jgi:hypothetical protein